jgi:peroxiredoxin Q/BCP
VLGISFDTPDDNKKFREKFDFPYDLLCDTSKATSIAFGVADADSQYPSRMSVLIGPDGKIAKAYATVKPADHPDQVLADLASLG